jgi:hypothetical protein
MIMLTAKYGHTRDKVEMKKKKNEAAAALGKLGGIARAKTLSKEQRSSVAKKAAQARWQKHRPAA